MKARSSRSRASFSWPSMSSLRVCSRIISTQADDDDEQRADGADQHQQHVVALLVARGEEPLDQQVVLAVAHAVEVGLDMVGELEEGLVGGGVVGLGEVALRARGHGLLAHVAQRVDLVADLGQRVLRLGLVDVGKQRLQLARQRVERGDGARVLRLVAEVEVGAVGDDRLLQRGREFERVGDVVLGVADPFLAGAHVAVIIVVGEEQRDTRHQRRDDQRGQRPVFAQCLYDLPSKHAGFPRLTKR